MPTAFRLPRPVVVLALAALVAGCGGGGDGGSPTSTPTPPTTPPSTPSGPPAPSGSVGFLRGWAQGFVTTDNGVPTSVGVRLSVDVLNTTGFPNTSVIVPLPATPGLPFDHVQLDWNPMGHLPAGVYHDPHYDIHFFMISQSARDRITLADRDAMFRAVPSAMRPPGYSADVTPFERMGIHWLDTTAPEFSGGRFTRTYIQGFHDGAMIFGEPMITKAFLETQPDVTTPIAQPATFPAPGRYPTRYRVRWDAATRTYEVTLEGLQPR